MSPYYANYLLLHNNLMIRNLSQNLYFPNNSNPFHLENLSK